VCVCVCEYACVHVCDCACLCVCVSAKRLFCLEETIYFSPLSVGCCVRTHNINIFRSICLFVCLSVCVSVFQQCCPSSIKDDVEETKYRIENPKMSSTTKDIFQHYFGVYVYLPVCVYGYNWCGCSNPYKLATIRSSNFHMLSEFWKYSVEKSGGSMFRNRTHVQIMSHV